MKKKLDDEVDLVEIFLQIWKKKHIILLTTIITLALGFIYQTLNEKEKKYLIKTEIRPLSASDELKYTAFDFYLRTLENLFIRKNILKNKFNSNQSNLLEADADNDTLNSILLYEKNFPNYYVNKELLYKLFLDKFYQNQILEKFMKSQVIDENQKNKTKELESILSELKSKIAIHNNELENKNYIDPVIFNFKSNHANDIKDLLNYIDQEINIEVYKHNIEMFDNYIGYLNSLKNHRVEDIESEIINSNSPIEKELLVNKKNILLNDKYIERIKEAFVSSPSKSSDFYAAKIHYKILHIKETNLKILILFGFVGIIIGIILILIITAIKSRELK